MIKIKFLLVLFKFKLIQIEEMINEVKFSKYVETNEFVEEINLDDFIRCKIADLFLLIGASY